MVKRCCYGICNSDTRYPERLKDGVSFVPFPKPVSNLEKCKRWIRLCGRPHNQLNVNIMGHHSKAKHFYVCTKHFIDGCPTAENPDPVPAIASDRVTPARRPPKPRPMSEPPRKMARTALTETFSNNTPKEVVCSTSSEPQLQKPNNQTSSTVVKENTEKRNSDLLAMAAENRQLKCQIAKLTQENENFLRNLQQREPQEKSCMLSVEKLKENVKKDEFVYYTGLPEDRFSVLFKFLVPCDEPFSRSRTISSREKMKMEDQLLMVMVKLRQNFDFSHLGYLFGISQQDANVIFTDWIQYMFFRCGSVPIWPHRDTIIAHMPSRYREEFPCTVVIIDGTELKIQRAISMTRQSQSYNTLKGLVGIDPRGSIMFVSMLFGGSISDTELTEQSGFLRLLEDLKNDGKLKDGDGIMVDKGFQIQEEVEKLGLKLIIPPFAQRGSQMSPSDIALTENIAKHRVHVKRAIARVKNFKILSHRIDLSHFPYINQIWFVCCFLTNFMDFLIK